MTSLLCGYLTWSYFSGRAENEATAEAIVDEIEGISARPQSIWLSLIFIFSGIAALVFGADLLIDGGVAIAIAAGVSKATIGLSLIALGTSLPELAPTLFMCFHSFTVCPECQNQRRHKPPNRYLQIRVREYFPSQGIYLAELINR